MNLPIFPEFKPIEINDRHFIHNTLLNFQPLISELTFTNLFMWRNYYNFKWSILNNSILFLAGDSGNLYLMQPVGLRPFKKTILTALDWLHEMHDQLLPRFERVDEETANEFNDILSIKAEPLPDHFDYLYNTINMVSLSGRKYHSKRNHLARFRAENIYNYKELTSDLIPKCLELTDCWYKNINCKENKSLFAEWKAIHEALTHYEQLHFEGGVILINDNVEAFALGELLNKSTAVIHIEKANSKIHGIYAAINQFFCENKWQNTSYINREQDLGETGLRTAKMSYRPQTMIKKYRISLQV